MSFNLSHYKKTLLSYKEAGYVIKNSCMNNLAEKDLHLVHDVDFTPSLALKLANTEKEVDAISTFFFRIKAKNYNLFSFDNIQVIKKLISMGHNVGLHYEPTAQNVDLKNDIESVIDATSKMLHLNVDFFNVHEPARTGIDVSKMLPEKNRSYNSAFFKGYKYLSDSGGRWREGCFSQHINKHDKLLVLTHPIWWYEEHPGENY